MASIPIYCLQGHDFSERLLYRIGNECTNAINNLE